MNSKAKALYIASKVKTDLRLTRKKKPTLQVTPKVYKTKEIRLDRIA